MLASLNTKVEIWLLLGFLLWGTAIGQNARQKPQVPRAARDKELQALIDMATAVAPEFGADVLIRLSESSKVSDRTTKMELLNKAFYLAPGAEQPVKRSTYQFMPDTRSGSLALAYRIQDLDSLSLQSRVVSDMLQLDAKKARDLLGETQFPVLAPVGCSEPLTYDVALFYQTIGLTARDGFTAKEKLEGRRLAFLVPYVSSLQSHAQIRPATQLLLNADLSSTDLGQLANMFAAALSQLHGDERSFAVTNMHSDEYSVAGSIASLIAVLDAKGISSVALLRSFREYLISNFNGERCGETADRTGKSSLPEAVRYFNRQFRLDLQNAQISPIAGEDLRSARIGPKFTDTSFWQTPKAKQLFAAARELRFGIGEMRLTTEKKATPEWSSQLTDFLTELAAWDSDSEPAVVDYICEKNIIYGLLIDVVPSGAERSKVIEGFVEFLEQNSVQTASRLEWKVPVELLLSGRVAADNREEVIQAFLNSQDPALNLYARLERWTPRNTSKTSVTATKPGE
jgi:hypothetical protein